MTLPVWQALPLTGRALVEASAGTGKTWTLAQLYLRLVLERGLQPPQIVVCTFTDAAAGELRGRIRERLQQAAAVLAGDAVLAGEPEVRGWLLGLKDRATARQRLGSALASVDLAPISTIHSYCQRVLRDHPFDTGGSFRPGELVDEGTLLNEVVRDAWRRRYLASTAVDAWELAWVLPQGPEALATHVRGMLDPGTVIDPRPALAAARAAWETLKSMSSTLKAAAADVRLYARSNSAIRTSLQKLTGTLDGAIPDPKVCDKLLGQLTPEAIDKAGPRGQPLRLDCLPALRELLPALAHADRLCRAAVACATLEALRQALQAQLSARGQLTFRQLIEAVHARITDPTHGPALATALAERHPVALIDEFQDTDAQQWAIFERIYPATAADRLLLLIGDPKQAIYRFRGGDIHTYLRALDSVATPRRYTIDRNFRSHPALLDGLNRLYAAADTGAFVDPRIRYQPVSAGLPETQPAGVLQLRLLAAPERFQPDKPSVGPLDEALWPAVAADIRRLIEAGTPPGDIAVLLDSNGRLGALRRALLKARIPVAGSGKRSVLAEPIAEELALLLYSLLHPGADRPLRGALATRLLGFDAATLLALDDDPPRWRELLERQQSWRERWFRHGVLALLDALLEARGPALRGETDGERLLTDLRHLGELLAAMEPDSVGPEALYARLQLERGDSGGGVASGERQLRVESDASRVQLMTLHAAKGLEFPVVLLPTVWRRISFRNRIPDVTQFASAAGRCYDPGGPDFERHWAREREEQGAERLRQLYVGLTRAKQRCVVYAWQLPLACVRARAELDDDAPLIQLLKAAVGHDGADWGEALVERLGESLTLTPPDQAVVDAALDASIETVPTVATPAVRTPLPTPRALEGRYSFTSLSRRMEAVEASRPAEDEVGADLGARLPEAVEEDALPQLQALASLKGPAFGDSLHALLEAALLGEPIDPAAQLGAAGLLSGDPALNAAAATAVGVLVEATLHSELAPGLTLAGLPPRARRPEFGFAFALGGRTPASLRAVLAEHGLAALWPVADAERALRGLMVGAIDLVYEWQGRFHVLDYKTNWLGERASDYRPEALDPAMRAHHYPLQALIYTVALHRYLSRRMVRIDAGGRIHFDYDPARHLGEAWYLFVRGLGTGPNHGIWRRRFPVELIVALDAALDGALDLAEAV